MAILYEHFLQYDEKRDGGRRDPRSVVPRVGANKENFSSELLTELPFFLYGSLSVAESLTYITHSKALGLL